MHHVSTEAVSIVMITVSHFEKCPGNSADLAFAGSIRLLSSVIRRLHCSCACRGPSQIATDLRTTGYSSPFSVPTVIYPPRFSGFGISSPDNSRVPLFRFLRSCVLSSLFGPTCCRQCPPSLPSGSKTILII
jgi:hypothetical protein